MGEVTNKKVPCFYCSNRSVTCHSDCERYLAYKKERDAVNENVRKQKQAINELNSLHFSGIEKAIRRHSKCGSVGQR
jgi:hypothetical protein